MMRRISLCALLTDDLNVRPSAMAAVQASNALARSLRWILPATRASVALAHLSLSALATHARNGAARRLLRMTRRTLSRRSIPSRHATAASYQCSHVPKDPARHLAAILLVTLRATARSLFFSRACSSHPSNAAYRSFRTSLACMRRATAIMRGSVGSGLDASQASTHACHAPRTRSFTVR